MNLETMERIIQYCTMYGDDEAVEYYGIDAVQAAWTWKERI